VVTDDWSHRALLRLSGDRRADWERAGSTRQRELHRQAKLDVAVIKRFKVLFCLEKRLAPAFIEPVESNHLRFASMFRKVFSRFPTVPHAPTELPSRKFFRTRQCPTMGKARRASLIATQGQQTPRIVPANQDVKTVLKNGEFFDGMQ
jgi:hypothetical protein